MKREAAVPGFRPGRAPRQLVEKRFRKQVADQVKSTLLMAALEQLDEDYKLNPITQPKLDVEAIELPDEGPMTFEMDVEVRPDFPLPAYKALTVKRPVRTITEADVEAQLKPFLERYAQLVPKLEGGPRSATIVTADLTLPPRRPGAERGQGDPVPAPARAAVPGRHASRTWARPSSGVKPGETREAEAKIGSALARSRASAARRSSVTFQVHDLKQLRLPEVNRGVPGLDRLRQPWTSFATALREVLERRLDSPAAAGDPPRDRSTS